MKKIINIKSKKTLVFALPALFLLSFGVSLAVSHDHATMANNFKLGGAYETLFVETFDSPQNWITCETIDKSLVVTNDTDSSGSISVRLKLEEQWIAADGTTELPLVSAASGLTMAQINFTPNSGWTKQGDYYYYNSDLAKNATTDSLITGVTLNCNANIDSVAGADSAYGDATYHLKITAQAIEAEQKDQWREIAKIVEEEVNPDSNIDFTSRAIVDSDPIVANGNGVNRATENGADVYYYRGEIDNNNIIWANTCWLIHRTTYSGGTKIVYNGLPTLVDGAQQCNPSRGENSILSDYHSDYQERSFSFNEAPQSNEVLADIGYMYGERIVPIRFSNANAVLTFSNDVTRNNNTYTLDTSAGQSITGTYADKRAESATRYHYFCTDGSSECDNTKIGYIINYISSSAFYYYSLDGYNNIDEIVSASFSNNTDSFAKSVLDDWFERNNYDDYEDDLEDAIFCNDRSFGATTALAGKDSAGALTEISRLHSDTVFGPAGRNEILNAQNNFEPSLDCPNKRDAFTVSDNTNGNAKLTYKVGLLTADEYTMAGVHAGLNINGYTSYLARNTNYNWTMSPYYYLPNNHQSDMFVASGSYIFNRAVTSDRSGIRPTVSLKAGTKISGGTGSKTDPYIVE